MKQRKIIFLLLPLLITSCGNPNKNKSDEQKASGEENYVINIV